MSIFASRTTQTIALPFDVPHTVTVQKLAGRHLQKAAMEKQVSAQAFVARMGGEAFRTQLAAVGDDKETAALVRKAQADPLNTYDRYVVLQKGIKAWSYDEPVSEQAIEDLDEEAVDFLARAILQLTKPGLFQTAAEVEEAKKNESAPLSLA